MSLNKTTISGNLGKAAELKFTDGGTPYVTFSLAVNDRVKQGDQWGDRTNWIPCKFWGKRAQGLQPYLAKGAKIAVLGHLRQLSWEKDGKRQSWMEVIVDDIELMSGRKKSGDAGGDEPPMSAYADMPVPQNVAEDDIPF